MAKKQKPPEIDKNVEAREQQAQVRRTNEAAEIAQEEHILSSVGKLNADQLNRRNEIADNLDKLAEREAQGFDGDKLVEDEPDEAAETEDAALRAEQEAEEERQRLEAEANERAAADEQNAGVVEVEPEEAPKKTTIKVHGRDIELTEAEVIEWAQKNFAADALREETERLTSAKRAVEQEIARPPSTDEAASDEKDITEDTLTSFLQGDREAIKEVAQQLRALKERKAPSMKDVLTAVRDDSSFRSAAERFKGDYKDVVEDPMLYRLVVAEDARLAQEEPKLSYAERLKRAGDHVRNWKQGLIPKATTPTPVNPKLAAKAKVAPVPQAGGRQQVAEDTEEEEPMESVIDKMARSRHQNGAIRKM